MKPNMLTMFKYGGITDAEAHASMRLFADQVMPELRATSTGSEQRQTA